MEGVLKFQYTDEIVKGMSYIFTREIDDEVYKHLYFELVIFGDYWQILKHEDNKIIVLFKGNNYKKEVKLVEYNEQEG